MTNEERVYILEKSFDLMEDIIVHCFIANDEDLMRFNVTRYKEKLEKKLKNEKDKLALSDALKKLAALSYEEIEEIYDIVSC